MPAVAMVAGASVTAGAEDRPVRSADRTETQKKARAAAPKAPAPATGTRRTVTLITGDRVTVDENGRVAGVQPAEGRERRHPEFPLSQVRSGEWRTNGSSIHTVSGGRTGRLSTGCTKRFTEGEPVSVTVRSTASAGSRSAARSSTGRARRGP
ncbi:hypothetical protein ACIQ9E_04530 [Streptomyces sp. NPDC094448]|uniref:hypothetical protein n=1 Tax=Streptomyces sp. NPDC094448 TaxID=3366063 RepID=UPI0038073FBF